MAKPYFKIQMLNPGRDYANPPSREQVDTFKAQNREWQAWVKQTGFQRDYATEVQANAGLARAAKLCPDYALEVIELTPIDFFSI